MQLIIIDAQEQRAFKNRERGKIKETTPTSSNSSGLYRFGTSPLLRILLISSRKDSSKAWVSLNRNTVGLFSTPVRKYRRFKSNTTKSSLVLLQDKRRTSKVFLILALIGSNETNLYKKLILRRSSFQSMTVRNLS